MKHLKMLGLAAIAALGLMAFLGAGSASATTLFTDAAHIIDYPPGTEIHATLTTKANGGTGSAILTGPSGEVLDTCPEATVSGKTLFTSSTSFPITIERLSWGPNCTNTTDTIKNGSLSIEWTEGDKGTLKGSGSEVTVGGIFGTSCTYGTGTGTTLGTFEGGTAPRMKINAIHLSKTAGSLICPSEAGWDADYTVTVPHAVHIGA